MDSGIHIDGFDGVHEAYGACQSNLEGRMLLELCVSNTCFNREEKRKVTFRIGESGKNDFVLIKSEHLLSLQDVKAMHVSCNIH